MFTDIVGYTTLTQRDEAAALRLLAESREILRPILRNHNGTEVKTIGDAFLIEFPSALGAVQCAVDFQKALKKRNASSLPEEKVEVRVGIHLGDVVHEGGDVYGDAVNVASRIEPLAEPNGICMTEQVYAHVKNAKEFSLVRVGQSRLKNVGDPVEVYRVEINGSTGEVTSLRTNRVAVLPLANISRDPKDEYFADGMTEELISTLSKIAGLRVIARTSVIRYKGTVKPIVEIGRELNVGTILEGSVRKSGNRIRVTAQLIDALNEEHLWVQDYERELQDVFVIQSDIAKRIARALKVHMVRREKLGIEKQATEHPGAHSIYLKGLFDLNSRTEEGLKRGIEYFEQALKEDPSYAQAYTGIAECYALLAWLEFLPPGKAFPLAKAAAEKALGIDDRLAETHTSLGQVMYMYDWDWPGAERELKLAIHLSPSYAPAHQYYSDYLKAMGRFDEALGEVGKARELDPRSLSINTGVGHVLYLSRQYDKAIEQYRETVRMDPKFAQARLWLGRPFLQKGMYDEALAELRKAVDLTGGSTISLAVLGHACASAGRKAEAKEILDRLIERSGKLYVPSYWVALIYVGLGDKDQAFSWLERAFQERSTWLVWAKVEPRFDVLRSDPRFTSLLKRMRLIDEKELREAAGQATGPVQLVNRELASGEPIN